MDIRDERVGAVTVLRLGGALKFPDGTALLRRRSRELVDSGRQQFVIDMLGVPWLDSSGIGEVVACFKRAREHDGTVKLVMEDRPYTQFTYCHLQKMFEIFKDVDTALASFDH